MGELSTCRASFHAIERHVPRTALINDVPLTQPPKNKAHMLDLPYRGLTGNFKKKKHLFKKNKQQERKKQSTAPMHVACGMWIKCRLRKQKGLGRSVKLDWHLREKQNHPLELQWERVTQMTLALATAKMLRESRAKRGFDSSKQQMCN